MHIMATSSLFYSTALLVISLYPAITLAKVVHLPLQNKLMFVGSNSMDLPATQRLCRSLGGDLPVLKDYYKDLEQIRKLTYEPIWLGVSRAAKPIHSKDPMKPYVRKYTWHDGSAFHDDIMEEIAPVSCNPPSCCTLRLRADPVNTRVTEVACNYTSTLPLCVSTLNSDNMAKILAADNVFTTSEDRLGLAMYVLPKFTKQLYDKVEGHRKTTHPIMYVLLVVCMCSLMVMAVMGIIYLRGNQGSIRKRTPANKSASPRLLRKENGQQKQQQQSNQHAMESIHEDEELITEVEEENRNPGATTGIIKTSPV
jgi:hypothetical protein